LKKPIRILHIFAPNYKSRFGGPIYRWRFYFSSWNNNEILHLVLDTKKKKLIDANEAFDFDFSDTQFIPSKFERFIWIFTLLRILIIMRKKYDLVHFHVLWWASFIIGFWSKINKIPAIYESVLMDSDTPGGIILEKFGKLKVILLKQFKGILSISDVIAEDYKRNGFLDHQVFTLKNSVNIDIFKPVASVNEKIKIRKKHKIPEEAKICLFVGSLIRRKGIDILLYSFYQALKQHPNLFLVIVGPKNTDENPTIDKSLISEMQEVIQSNNITNNVFFTGLLQNKSTLIEYYQMADIFLFPSRQEGLPNVVLEAMSSGLPVIVSKLPVLESIIIHGRNGILINIGDVNNLRDEIVNVAGNPLLAKKIGLEAREYIANNHSFDKCQNELAKIYNILVCK